jgi:multidrug efflux pump subunit AcrA (membrane-fusion protein)
VACAVAFLTLPGCAKNKEHAQSVTEPPVVQVLHPEVRTIKRIVGQPSFVEAYERTSIYPKVTAYIKKWNVDIGDTVKKGELLAKLWAPEYDEDWETKKATVDFDFQRIALAREEVDVADANVKAAKAALDEAKAVLARYQAQVDRWLSEVKRLTREVERGVVDPQVLLESENQLKASSADRDAAKATIEKREADLLSAKATLSKDKVAVQVAEEAWKVAKSNAKWAKAWVDYLDLTAPFDGVVVGRNANTEDFVHPGKGDPSAMQRAPFMAPGNTAAPIFVVDRMDIIRIFVDVPEGDANYVKGEDAPTKGDDLVRWLLERKKSGLPMTGTKAMVQIRGYKDAWIPATVTRTAWALNVTSRTLRAEIDLLNPGGKILPGMYAYAKLIITRPDVRAIPMDALTHSGDQTYCWMLKDGKAARTEVQTGVNDGKWIEVTNRQGAANPDAEDTWEPIDGKEQMIVGDLSVLTDGGAVKVDSGHEESKIASTASHPKAPAGNKPKGERVE